MINKKQNSWAKKLEGLDGLPGEPTFDKEAAWEKLHSRLDKRRKPLLAWYWVAALLIPAIILLWVMTNYKETTLVNTATPRRENKEKIKPALPQTQQQRLIVDGYAALNYGHRPLNAEKKLQPAPSSTKKTDQQLVKPASPTVIDSQAMLAPMATIDTFHAINLVATKAKRLRVIHINELETIPDQLTAAPTQERSRFRVTLARGFADNQAPPSKAANENIFNVKISLKTN